MNLNFQDIYAIVAFLSIIIGVAIGLSGWLRNFRRDAEENSIMLIENELRYIKAGIEKIYQKIDVLSTNYTNLSEKNIKLEMMIDAMGKRIDTIEKKIGGENFGV